MSPFYLTIPACLHIYIYTHHNQIFLQFTMTENDINAHPENSYKAKLPLWLFLPSSLQTIQYYICSLCKGIYYNPVMDSCNHIFCSECFNIYYKQYFACPIQGEPISQSPNPVAFISNIISKQQVYCFNKSKNCTWNGEVKDLWTHLDEDCEKEIVKCKNEGCGIEMERIELITHSKECVYRLEKCEFCNEQFPFVKIPSHHEYCPKYKVKCLQKCGMDVERGLIEEHVKNDCPFTEVCCPYQKYGCTHGKIIREEMEKVIKNDCALHLKIVVDFVDKLEERVNKIENGFIKMKLYNDNKSIHNNNSSNNNDKRVTSYITDEKDNALFGKAFKIDNVNNNNNINNNNNKNSFSNNFSSNNNNISVNDKIQCNTPSDKEEGEITFLSKKRESNNSCTTNNNNKNNNHNIDNTDNKHISPTTKEPKDNSTTDNTPNNETSIRTQLSTDLQQPQETIQPEQQQQQPPLFDTINKSPYIVITGPIARNISPAEPEHKFLFFSKSIDIYSPPTKFEYIITITLLSNSNWLAFGLCDKAQVLKNKMQFVLPHKSFQQSSHGAFLISSNDYSWNCNVPEENNAYVKAGIRKGMKITLKYNNQSKELIFITDNNIENKLTNVYPVHEGNNILTPCILFLHKGDGIEYISSNF